MRLRLCIYIYSLAVFYVKAPQLENYRAKHEHKPDIIRKEWYEMDKNILLTIEYDGSVFHGWQRQPDRETVQGHLETVLSSLLHTEILLNGTSRTDAGVHAYGQRASFTADVKIPVEKLALVINNILRSREKGSFAASPVRIVKVEEKPADFHARFDSKGKKYIYRIHNAEKSSVFLRNYVYHVPEKLDTDAMRRAAEYLRGTHDFKSFEASGSTPRQTTVRTIYDAEIIVNEESACSFNSMESEDSFKSSGAEPGGDRTVCRTDRNIEIHVSGDGFLYNMVRIITGTLVDIGAGKLAPEEMKRIIEARDRTKAGHTAPPYGLYLAEVYY